MKWNFGHIDFTTYPHFDAEPLGAHYFDDKTILRLWAPTAQRVILRLYREGWGDDHFHLEDLIQKEKHWVAELPGKWHGIFYTIQCMIGNNLMDEVPDPYAFTVGVNGKRAMFCDFLRTNPEGWNTDQRVLPKHLTDLVLYELHVRDFSIDEFSGIKNKGKYLAFTEKGTRSPEGIKTGLDHLLELGITHVHLLPVFDFFTVDESRPENNEYNWGYDPLNYNSPEGSYATNPNDGITRVAEFKQMVQALHRNGIGVIMDVVYSHTGLTNHSSFNQTVPGYFYRQRPNGTFSDASGCGNEIASERVMVRKYIIDSLKFWAEEYHIDGFRFDLMGIYDIETMNAIRAEMDKIDPKLILYGEGWTAASSPMNEQFRAIKNNTPKLDRIAVFNDDFRDAIKGHWGIANSLGFASGQTLNEESVKYAIVAATDHPQINYGYIASASWAWAISPQQSVNYISCHDNYTLYDKLKLSHPNAKLQELSRMVCLAGSVLLTSQGIPFLHAGVEMMRTKKGHGNTYNMGDEYNLIDWSRKAMFSYVTNYFKKLIEIRKKHPAFRMQNTEQIQKHLSFSKKYIPGVVSYKISEYANGDSWRHIQVIFNNNSTPIVFPVKKQNWKIIANGLAIDENGLFENDTHSMFVPPVSMLLIVAE
ncbi:MAG TPA: type I pullulanase [Prolixibacteraceae bacterium]|nr:type I pullulanase [Prolixibacteraceae bacterium]